MNKNNPILLIEDDRVDTMTVKRAVRELKIPNALVTVSDGEKGLAYLQDETQTKPFFILLDLNMPRMNGIEFLQVVKKDPILKRIPVIVLTTSREQQDKINSFDLSVAGYMAKPVDYKAFVAIIETIYNYWDLSESVD